MSRKYMPREAARKMNMVPLPSKPADNSPAHVKMAYWRINIMNLTQEELGKYLGLRRSTIWRYETGEQPMSRNFRLACLGLYMLRPWHPNEWPYFGSDRLEGAVFKRLLVEDPDVID